MTATRKKTYTRPQTIKLAHMPLLFGIMDKMKLDSLVDSRIAKVGPHVQIQSGSLLKLMCACYMSGRMPSGISSVQAFASTLPAVFLGKELAENPNPYQYINRYVVGDLLDRIAEYGATRFASEIVSSVVDVESVEVAHLDSTSYHVHGRPQSSATEESGGELCSDVEDLLEISNKPLTLAQGYSRDNRPDLAQVNQLGICAKTKGIDKAVLLYQAAFDGNMNDITRFQQLCADGELDYLKKTYPNLRTLVGDSALASAKSIHACHKIGIELVTRLQDSKVRRDFADVNAGKIKLSTLELPVPEWETQDAQPQKIQYAWLPSAVITTTDKSEVKVQRVLFVAEAMREKKTVSLRKKAEDELQEVSAALKKLQTSPRLCMADAVRDFKALTSKLKLVSVDEPVYEEVMGYATAGRPKAGAEKKVIAVKVFANAVINEEALKSAINSALYYVLATTNMKIKQDRNTALDLHRTYHGQSQIESQWRDIKATGTFFDSLFLKSPERIRSILAIINIALLVGRILMGHVHKVLKSHSLSISMYNMPVSQRPTLKTFIRFATSEAEESYLMVSPDFVSMPETISDSILYLVAEDIGDCATRLYSEEFYDEERQYIYDSMRTNRTQLRIKTNNAMSSGRFSCNFKNC